MSWLMASLVAGAEVGALLLPWLIRGPERGPRLSLGQTLRFTRVRAMLPLNWVGLTVLIHGAVSPWAIAALLPFSAVGVAWMWAVAWLGHNYSMGPLG